MARLTRTSCLTGTLGRLAGRAFRRWGCLWLGLVLAGPGLAARQPSEYEAKAAFLLNFTRFVEWPPRAYADESAPLVLGIVGEDPFRETLPAVLRGQTAQGRPIQIRYLKPDEDCAGCHVLFFSRSLEDKIHDLLARLRNQPVLTVSDQADFTRYGGIIGFSIVDKAVRFDINARAAEQAGLKPSTRLFAVAKSVLK